MKLTNTIGLLFALTASTSAASYFHPYSDSVTVKLSNDWSGASAKAHVSTDGKPHSINSLYGHSDLERDGKIYATSAELTDFHQDTVCLIVQHEPHVHATLDAEATWTFLDRGAWVEVDNGHVICHGR
ncbi:hypothetical protein BBP40_012747 [Aspergillus hancockii]|nr:hypothetical protein BBP40_012747 [Aspergillus hancockii]